MYGSSGNTSSAAPATWPDSSASTSASRSTRLAAGGVDDPHARPHQGEASRRRSGARVSAVSGACSVTKSAGSEHARRARPASPGLAAALGATRTGRRRSRACPAPRARAATSWPMRPKPSTRERLVGSSTPAKRLRSQRPCTSAAWACGMLRASASSRPTACSAADTMFEPGALQTMMPRRVAAATSTLSTPGAGAADHPQPRPVRDQLGVTRVAQRTTSASYPPIRSQQLGRRQARASTSTVEAARAAARRRRAAIGSVTRTLGIGVSTGSARRRGRTGPRRRPELDGV